MDKYRDRREIRRLRGAFIYRRFLRVIAVGLACFAMSQVPALAGDDKEKDNSKLEAVPFVFVGNAGDCGTGYPAASRIVTSDWLTGMGLPDNGGANTTAADLATNPNKKDPHTGLLLSKNGPTADCSSAGATIKGVKGIPVNAAFALGFDYRNGGHCGAGAPRFNVVTTDGVFHFVGGCANGIPTPASQDPLQWSQVRFVTANPAQSFPPILPGSAIKSIDLIFDEGTDTANNDTEGVGLAVVDNIFINGQLITSGATDCKNQDQGDNN
jgi:hypothetical protein